LVVLLDSDWTGKCVLGIVNCLNTCHLELTDQASLLVVAEKAVVAILWIIARLFPLDVVPTFVDIFVRSVEISPSLVVSRCLELEFVDKDASIIHVTHEVLDL